MICHEIKKKFAPTFQQVKQPTVPGKQPSFISVQKIGPIPKKPAEKSVLAHKLDPCVAKLLYRDLSVSRGFEMALFREVELGHGQISSYA